MLKYQLKPIKKGVMIVDTIDVHDLPEEDINLLQEIVEFLRKRAMLRQKKTTKEEKIDFASWPLGVKGKLTRKEIYDHL